MEIALVVFGVVLAGVLVWNTLLTQRVRALEEAERKRAADEDADARTEKARAVLSAIRKRRSARRA